MLACLQDSYALCRVFKKNGICAEAEEQQGQCSISIIENSQSVINESETMSPDIPMASSTCVDDPEDQDKDDSWMQFITDDDSWCPNSNIPFGGDEVARLTFTN